MAALDQDLVDEVFRRSLAEDVRTLAALTRRVRERVSDARHGGPTDHEIQIALSRNCMGEGEWDYFPAYSAPPRYVSRARVIALAQLEVTHGLDAWQRIELDALIQRARHYPMEGVAP